MTGSLTIDRRRALFGIATVAAALATSRGAFAAEQVYGSQLMTEQEQQAYRDRMRRATSDEERARIRAEHHAQMQERARQQGKTLPDQPPAAGRGPGAGMGGGMGGGMPGQPRMGRGPGGGQGAGGGGPGR